MKKGQLKLLMDMIGETYEMFTARQLLESFLDDGWGPGQYLYSMKRKVYYDAEPWYQRENTIDWYQQMEKSNETIKLCLSEAVDSNSLITEVACGGGWLAEFIVDLKPKLYRGFDFAETAVKNASQRIHKAENFRCFQGDALSLESYDPETNFILAHQFLHCLIGDDRRIWLLICNKTLSKNSGSLLLSSMIGLPASVKNTVEMKTRINKPGNRYYAEDAEIQRELRSSGFKITQVLYPEDHIAVYKATTLKL